MSGFISIPAGAFSVAVSGLGFGRAPSRISYRVVAPAGAPDNVWATMASAVSADGFTVYLSGAPSVAGYVLQWEASALDTACGGGTRTDATEQTVGGTMAIGVGQMQLPVAGLTLGSVPRQLSCRIIAPAWAPDNIWPTMIEGLTPSGWTAYLNGPPSVSGYVFVFEARAPLTQGVQTGVPVTAPIQAGQSEITVTGLALGQIPTGISYQVIAPPGAPDNIVVTMASALTTDGFTLYLNGPPSQAGYVVACRLFGVSLPPSAVVAAPTVPPAPVRVPGMERNLRVAPCTFDPETTAGANPGGEGGLGRGERLPQPDATLVSVTVGPTPAFCEVGGSWQFTATADYSDGSRRDVTARSKWSVQASAASVSAAGLATGLSSGIETVVAEFERQTGYGQLEVALACHDQGVDFALVLPRDSAMLQTERGLSRIQHLRAAALAMVSALDTATDQAAVVSYAGSVLVGVPQQTLSDAAIDCALTNNQGALSDALRRYRVRGPCLFPDPNTGPNNKCAIGLGAALQAAFEQVTGPSHNPDSRQFIAVVVDGRNRVAFPDPAEMAAQITAAGINLIIIGIKLSGAYAATLAAYALPGNFFNGTAADAANVLARLAYMACVGSYPYGYGYTAYAQPPPASDPAGAIAGALNGLRWELPCVRYVGRNRGGQPICSCEQGPVTYQTRLGGTPSRVYTVTARFRGVVEGCGDYAGGTPDGLSGFYVGGYVGPQRGEWRANRYALIVTPPGSEAEIADGNWLPTPGVSYQSRWYFLNFRAGAPTIAAVDYTEAIQIEAGALVTLYADAGGDGLELQNLSVPSGPITVPGIPPYPAAFNGQFIEMDVLSVA